MGAVTDAYLAGFEAGYDMAVELARGQAAAADFARSMDEVQWPIEAAPSYFTEVREAWLADNDRAERTAERIRNLSGDVKFTFVAGSRRCDSGAGQGGQEGADGCDNHCSGLLKRFSRDVEDA